MLMTPQEIVTSYKQAKKQTEQIKILADLNECTTDGIINILVNEGGYDIRRFGSIKGRLKDKPSEQSQSQPKPKKTSEPKRSSWKVYIEKIKAERAKLIKVRDRLASDIKDIEAELSAIDKALGDVIDG